MEGRGRETVMLGVGAVPRRGEMEQIQVGGKNSDEEGGGDDTKNRED
jgi:hypothetical protein